MTKKKTRLLLAMVGLVSLLFSILPAGSEVNAGDVSVVGPYLQDAMGTETEPLEVVVTFDGEGAPTAEQVDLLHQTGIENGFTYKALPMAAVIATAEQVKQLAGYSEIRSIYYNKQLEYDNDDATALTGVDKARTDDEFTKQNGGLPISGEGVGVLINDTGVDGAHKDLEFGSHLVQNVQGATNLNAYSDLLPITYIEDQVNTDTVGHGTHVTGIVGGTGAMSNGKYEGVAPGADLVSYGSGAGLFLVDVLGGFDYALTHRLEYGIRVVTNSWGTSGDTGTDFKPDDPINVATKRLFDRGIVVVFSAGNSGPEEGTITGNYKKAPWVIAVAAGTKEGELADFSSRGEEGNGGTVTVDGETYTWGDRPTVTAPGVDIVSTGTVSVLAPLGTSENIEPAYAPYYKQFSGTSMAAPHVAGIVALMLEANPELAPLEVQEIIRDTASTMSGYGAWEAGAGYVNAYDAVEKAFELAEQKTTGPKKPAQMRP